MHSCKFAVDHRLTLLPAPAVPPGGGAATTGGRAVLFASKGEVPGVYKALALNVAASGARYTFGWVSGQAPAAFREQAMGMFKVRLI